MLEIPMDQEPPIFVGEKKTSILEAKFSPASCGHTDLVVVTWCLKMKRGMMIDILKRFLENQSNKWA